MVRPLAVIFGILFVVGAILGSMPAYAPEGILLSFFRINLVHNLIHLSTGIIALIVGFKSLNASKLFFRIFGVIYLIAAILGIYYGEEAIFGVVANNMPDVGLHFVVAIIALYLGFRSESIQKA